MATRTPTSDVDFGKRSSDYAEHRPGFPRTFFDRLETFGSLSGTHALDLGTGPGVVALELARRGAKVTGIDISENQIRAAEKRARDQGLATRCTFLVRAAEDTGVDAAGFDLAIAGQCWIWFDEARTLGEMRRVLKVGRLLVIAHYCYLPHHSDVARASEELILKYNPTWTMGGHDGLYPGHIDQLINGGFDFVEQFCYDHDQSFTHESWRGRMRTCNGVGSGRMTRAGVDAFDRELQWLLAERFGDEPMNVRHRVWAVVVRKPGYTGSR